MDIFAHKGVEHATSAEAAGHSTADVVVTVLLVTAVVAGLLVMAVAVLRKLNLIKLRDKERKE